MGDKRTPGSIPENVARYIKGPDIHKQWTCLFPNCKNLFRRKSRIMYHVQAHLGDRQHRRQHCNKRFIRAHDKKRHENIQRGKCVGASSSNKSPLSRRLWTQAEDKTLIQLLDAQEVRDWVQIAQLIGTRSSKQCCDRYNQKWKVSLNHDPISHEEGLQITQLIALKGNRWSEIARILGDRSDNAVKNWWNKRKRHSTTASPCSPQHALTVNPGSNSINATPSNASTSFNSPTALPFPKMVLWPLNNIDTSGAFSTPFYNDYSMTPLFKGVEQYSTHRPHFHKPYSQFLPAPSIPIPSLPPLRMNLSYLMA